MYVCMRCVWVDVCQRTVKEGSFSPLIEWVLGMEFRSSGLTGDALTHGAISPACRIIFPGTIFVFLTEQLLSLCPRCNRIPMTREGPFIQVCKTLEEASRQKAPDAQGTVITCLEVCALLLTSLPGDTRISLVYHKHGHVWLLVSPLLGLWRVWAVLTSQIRTKASIKVQWNSHGGRGIGAFIFPLPTVKNLTS